MAPLDQAQPHDRTGTGAAISGERGILPGISTIHLASPRATCLAELARMAEGQARGPTSFLPAYSSETVAPAPSSTLPGGNFFLIW